MKKEYFSPEIEVESFLSTSLLADVSYIDEIDGDDPLSSKSTIWSDNDEDEE